MKKLIVFGLLALLVFPAVLAWEQTTGGRPVYRHEQSCKVAKFCAVQKTQPTGIVWHFEKNKAVPGNDLAYTEDFCYARGFRR